MIWIAIALGLLITGALVWFARINAEIDRKERALKEHYEWYGYSEHERLLDLAEKWSDPPEVDDE
jgi:hypothetical protein